MAAISDDQHVVRFGDFALDLQSGELTKKGRRSLLPDQPVRILARLVRFPGVLVTRDDLRREPWRHGTLARATISHERRGNR